MAALRVVQWATGNIGTRSLRGAIEHPELELVGVQVHSSDKAGRDAGELCGLDRRACWPRTASTTCSPSEADCILYMPQACDIDEVCRLLESGANIVTTRGEFHHPASIDAGVARASRPRARPARRRSTAPAAAPASSPRRFRSC